VAPEPEVSSPHSQKPSSGPYPEPGQSTPHPPPPTNLPKVHFDPILLSTPWSSDWAFSFELSHQNPVHVSPLSHACHTPCPPHSPWFDLPNNIRWWVQIMKLPTVHTLDILVLQISKVRTPIAHATAFSNKKVIQILKCHDKNPQCQLKDAFGVWSLEIKD
jgi:hypothetical protein